MKNSEGNDTWSLRFDSFSFGARCYNTIRCSILYGNQEHSVYLDEPSGAPYSPDWKKSWSAGYIVMPEHVFPPPVQVKWTSMDGVENRASVDIEAIFPGRKVLHEVPREDLWEEWAKIHSHAPYILLEVNDRTINVYMKVRLLTKHSETPAEPDLKISRNDLVLAWTNTY